MSRTNKVTIFIILGIFVAIISLFTCVTVFGSANACSGVALENIEIYEAKINDISDIYFENGTFEILKTANLEDKNIINYGLLLKKVDNYAQFQFDVENKGNIDVKIKNISILGYEEYKDYVDIKVDGINIGDTIEKSSVVSGIKVITTYKNPQYMENGFIKFIELNNLKIVIEFDKE